MVRAWAIGESITAAEYVAVCARIFGRRRPHGHPDRVVAGMVALFPLRLEHEMNRLRGIAFDVINPQGDVA